MKTLQLFGVLAVFLLGAGIGLASCGIATGVVDIIQAGLVSTMFGLFILFVLSLKGR